MQRFTLYNSDVAVAKFELNHGTIVSFKALLPELLPMQLRNASADTFTLWLQNRSIDLNTFQHRQLARELLGTRDKTAIAIITHMFSVTDTFTCFIEGEFQPREKLCNPESQNDISGFILVSSDTSLNKAARVTPNASTDGSYTKTWRFEDNRWWLYKLQSEEATNSEVEISKALRACGWDAAEYQYVEGNKTRVKSLNFVHEGEFFEPYDSFRYSFMDRSDDDRVIYNNISSLGIAFEEAWIRILLADALFMNTDRHMRNFGFIRSAETGRVLRMAPNYDNNQAYTANPGRSYTDAMLKEFFKKYGDHKTMLQQLVEICETLPYLDKAARVGKSIL